MKKILALLVVFLAVGLSRWGYSASPPNYLPLQEGLTWEYQYKIFELKDKKLTGEAKAIKKNLPPMDMEGTKVVPQTFSYTQAEKGAKQESSSFIAQDKDGFYVFGRQDGPDKQPIIYTEKFYILKSPLTKGTSWKQDLEGLVIQNTIEGTDATVQVPAGAFNGCLLLKKQYFQKTDPKKAVQESLLWFAPDVGTIKAVMKNPQQNEEILQELVSFKK